MSSEYKYSNNLISYCYLLLNLFTTRSSWLCINATSSFRKSSCLLFLPSSRRRFFEKPKIRHNCTVHPSADVKSRKRLGRRGIIWETLLTLLQITNFRNPLMVPLIPELEDPFTTSHVHLCI